VWEWEHIELLEEAAARQGLPENKLVPVHLKVDTGMARLGVALADVAKLARSLQSTRHVVLQGVFTHLASAEIVDAPDVEAQIGRFDEVVATIAESGLAPSYFHMANSAAMATRPRTWRNMVRPGIALYGYYLPFTSAEHGVPGAIPGLPVRPVLSWKTRVISLRQVPARQPVGYDGAYVTQAPARIAALPVGYADGLNRQLSSRGHVIVHDELVPIVGNISMDLTLVDVTHVRGVEVGDEVILLGESPHCRVTAQDHATWAHTIAYEILCGISKRVPRRYLE
ncbi:MAG: alanine racemase, partial [Terriglobales bacterium]